MFGWFSKKRVEKVEEDTKKGFESVKKDFEHVGKWIKHLDEKDKQLFETLQEIKAELSSIKDELEQTKDVLALADSREVYKQVLKKTGVLNKQTAVEPVYEPVQTPVQTANFYEILQGLSSNERLVVFTLMNADEGMKLSYEDLARLLGKERSTIRGQINAIKQKSEGLLHEIVEPNGRKRVYIDEEVRNKLLKYAKVRVKDKKKSKKRAEKEA